jgi:hypothetical protein
MIVTEVTDRILVALSHHLHGVPPKVRPLTPAVEKVHRELRGSREVQALKAKQVERIADPGWSVRQAPDSDFSWVGERTENLMIVPTSISAKPALLSSRRNTRHGTDASARVDSNPERRLYDSKVLLKELLAGREVVVEFHEEPHEESRLVAYPLEGFPDAWEAACERLGARTA